MTGFELGSSGIGSDHAVNCATTSAPNLNCLSAYLHCNQCDQIWQFIILWATFQTRCHNYFAQIANTF